MGVLLSFDGIGNERSKNLQAPVVILSRSPILHIEVLIRDLVEAPLCIKLSTAIRSGPCPRMITPFASPHMNGQLVKSCVR